jgi:flagellar hook assembly protein FlgD
VSYQPFLITSLEDAQGIIVGQSFPNPFNHTITIPYQVPYRSTYVVLSIYDTAGQLIRVLQNGITQPGRHDALWDGKDGRGREVANGVYICRIEARDALRPEITTARIAIVR